MANPCPPVCGERVMRMITPGGRDLEYGTVLNTAPNCFSVRWGDRWDVTWYAPDAFGRVVLPAPGPEFLGPLTPDEMAALKAELVRIRAKSVQEEVPRA